MEIRERFIGERFQWQGTRCGSGIIPSHVQTLTNRLTPKEIHHSCFDCIDACGIPLTQLSSIWEFRSLSIRSGQACPGFPTILQGLTQKSSRTSATTGHTESLIREIQTNLVDLAELWSI